MYCDVKWISAFFVLFVQPLPGGVMHSYVLSGFAREASAHRATVVDSIPFTHPAHVPALLELLRHQCAINTLLRSCVTSQGAGTGGRFIYFLTSWNLWKMDELGQEKWKRVSNQMLFFFFFDGSVCDLHHEVLPESETSFSVTFHRPDSDSLAVCEH